MMHIIVKMKFGAHLYGTATSESDLDYKGVFLPTKEQLLLGRVPKSHNYSTGKDDTRNTKNDVDTELYSLRTILCCRWVITRVNQPPVKIRDLLNEFLPSGELRELVDKQIDLKINGTESTKITRSLFFEEYLESQHNFIENNIPKNPEKIPIEKFDSVFQKILSESDS